MPTASTESTEKKAPQGPIDALGPIKQALGIVDRKIRNLEKRKNKLDAIKEKADSGVKLELDQQIAIEKYNEVEYSLEYSRELHKQFSTINTEATKLLKKQVRREKLDRQHREIKRVQELLKLQNLLDSLGTDDIRSDFQTGKHGAVVLTEENLRHLDELYQLISPTRDGEGSYHTKVNKAAEHIVSLLEGKNKEVLGTTYKDLKELIDLIKGCGYFEVVQQLENEAAAKASAEVEVATAADQAEGNTEAVSSEDGKPDSQTEDSGMDLPTTQVSQEGLEQGTPPQLNNMASSSDSAAYYGNEAFPQAPCQRPIDEIVSSVQGSFNFLQESTIDVDSVAHTDPAVVAAQPMSRQTSQQTPDSESRPLSGFGTQSYERQTDPANTQTSQLSNTGRADQQQRYTASDQTTHSQQNMDYPTSQPFRQNALPQNLQSDSSLFPSSTEDSSHGMMNQGGQDNSLAQFDIPPSIPLPQSQDNQQSNISNQSEKKFTMNAAAPVFQSMYTQSGGQDQGGDDSNHFSQNADNGQNNRYQNDGFQQRGPRRDGGGYRNNRGGRGGNGGSGGNNMQNGYNRSNSGSGSGSGQNSGRGGRGGSYQGYPPRTNYQPDGFQGYNNNSGGYNQGYKQRSGSGNNQGQMRGSSGTGASTRGGSGGVRGGPGRGGSSNNTQRGGGQRGSGGNIPRQNSAQYQQ